MSSNLQPSTSTDAAVVLRRADERFHTRLDWLDSRHTFSFGAHHDPAWMGFGPLRVINDDTIAPGRGFGLHPHRDMEIVTVMVAGELEHRDSLGNGAFLRAGEVQSMSAGTGIQHSERNRGPQPCRLIQIWIEPDQTGLAPAYAQRPFTIHPDWTPLIDPQGRGATLALHRAVRLWRARPEPGMVLSLPVAAGEAGWLQLLEGSVRMLGTADRILPAHGAEDGPHGRLELSRGDGLGLLARSGARQDSLEVGPEGADLLLFAIG